MRTLVEVEKYLSRAFYNLNTVAPHNWRSYHQMRHVAKHKFGLDIVSDQLPVHTLEQVREHFRLQKPIKMYIDYASILTM